MLRKMIVAGLVLGVFSPVVYGGDWDRCPVLEKLAQAENLLRHMPLRVWEDKTEDPTKEVGLALMDKECSLHAIKIIKRRNELVSHGDFRDYEVQISPRFNRTWNSYATQFTVTAPEGLTPIRIKYPLVKRVNVRVAGGKKGTKPTYRKQTMTNEVITVAYNPDLRLPEILAKGWEHLDNIISQSFAHLKSRSVFSRAYPDLLIVDVLVINADIVRPLPLLEQSDPDECFEDCVKTSDMILIRLGADLLKAFANTRSSAQAHGLMQYTKGTYEDMRRLYPSAKLEKDFLKGTADHINSMTAAILLYDYNLSLLIKRYGAVIADDSYLKEYLAAAYNGGPGRVTATIDSARQRNLEDWTQAAPVYEKRRGRNRNVGIVRETIDYISKYRQLEKDNTLNGLRFQNNDQ